MSRRLYEINCECIVQRNGIEVEIKGVKGRLRKVVLKEILKPTGETEKLPTPIIESNLNLKQSTMDSFLNIPKQQCTEEKKEKKILLVDSMYTLQIYASSEKIHDLNLRDLDKINKNLIQKGFMTYFFNCRENGKTQTLSILFSNSTEASLKILLDWTAKIQAIFGNTQKINEKKNENQPQQQKVVTQQLNEMQLMKLKRKGIKIQDHQIIPVQKQIIDQQVNKIPKNQDLPQKQTNNTIAPIKKIPNFLIGQIISYCTQKEIYRMRIVSKIFSNEAAKNILILSFKRHIEVPENVLFQLLNKMNHIEQLHLGRVRNIKANMLLEGEIPTFTFLKDLDLGDYTYLNDKLLQRFIEKCQHLISIVLPYNSKITSTSIRIMLKFLQKLNSIKFKADYEDTNETINENCFTSLLKQKQNDLEVIKLPRVHISLFENLRTELQQFTLQKLKIKQIYVRSEQEGQESLVKFFTLCPNLSELSIKQLILNKQPYTSYNLIKQVERVFVNLKTLKILKLGEFCNNQICEEIAKNLPELKKIKINSKHVQDQGLQCIFNKCQELESINIASCIRIIGDCFEFFPDNLQYKRLFLKIQLDEQRLEYLENILENKGYDFQIENVKPEKNKKK